MKIDPCELAEDLMPLSLDGNLSWESRAFLEKHLRECPECRRLSDSMREERETKRRIQAANVYEHVRWRTVTLPILLTVGGMLLLLTVLTVLLTWHAW